MSTRPKELTRFLKFSVVGAIGFVIDFGTFNLLHGRAGVAEIPASVVSFLAAVTSNFLWNRYWTYPDSRTKSVRRQAIQFGVVSLAGLAIRTPAFALLLGPCTDLAGSILAVSPALAAVTTADTLGANLALGAVVVIVLFWNFFVNRYWTYADVDSRRTSADRPQAGTPPV
ncbi:MAG TPA: GtrA family protein [Anaerolineales bacterium]|nr:GtrA family protein [Anaerolineales bacterium]